MSTREYKKETPEEKIWRQHQDAKLNHYWRSFLQFLASIGLDNIFWSRRKKYSHTPKEVYLSNKVWCKVNLTRPETWVSDAFYGDETKEGEEFWNDVSEKWAKQVEKLKLKEPKF